jgi:hypothetical protein
MLHKEFWGLMFLAFIGWAFLGADGGERIERGCRPLGWTGNAVVSLTALGIPSQQARVDGWFKKFEYGCQYMTWRLVYEDDYTDYLNSAGSPVAPGSGDDPVGGDAALSEAPGAEAEPSVDSAPVIPPPVAPE